MWIIILGLVLATLIYFLGIRPLNFWKERGVSTTKAWPFVGHFGAMIFRTRSLVDSINDIYKAFPEKRYVGFYAIATPALIVRDPDLIKKITIKEFETFPQHKPFVSDDVDPLWSKNLFAMKGGEKWQDMRATLSPSFTSSKMKMMFHLMKECAKQFSNHYLKQGGTVTIDMKDAFTRFSNDVIATTAFGVTCDSLKHRENEFYLMGKEATTFTGRRALLIMLQVISPTIPRLLNMGWFTNPVSKFFRSLIKETLRVREEQGIIRPDMIHLLMEARKGRLKYEDPNNDAADSGFATVQESEIGRTQKRQKTEITDEDLTAQALVFFFAGFDTVSTTLSYASYELAINPDVQEKLRQEVDDALEKFKGDITYETLMGMKYLDMVVTETLRKWPPSPAPDRHSVKPFTIEPEQPGEKPLHLEAGSLLFIPIYSIQRDPQYYPNPDKFDPERFSEDNKHNIKPFTYLPFGAGPRNCIGSRFALLECKLAITEIISKFEIVPVEKTPIPIVFSKKNFNPVPDEGIVLGLKPRNNAI